MNTLTPQVMLTCSLVFRHIHYIVGLVLTFIYSFFTHLSTVRKSHNTNSLLFTPSPPHSLTFPYSSFLPCTYNLLLPPFLPLPLFLLSSSSSHPLPPHSFSSSLIYSSCFLFSSSPFYSSSSSPFYSHLSFPKYYTYDERERMYSSYVYTLS